jgi:hypothetical protein
MYDNGLKTIHLPKKVGRYTVAFVWDYARTLKLHHECAGPEVFALQRVNINHWYRRCCFRIKTMFFYLQVFIEGLMSYLRYLCLLAKSGVRHILCRVFIQFFFVLCTTCCQFLWLVQFWSLGGKKHRFYAKIVTDITRLFRKRICEQNWYLGHYLTMVDCYLM